MWGCGFIMLINILKIFECLKEIGGLDVSLVFLEFWYFCGKIGVGN